ncbi:MAG TPA: glycosyltransferase [Gaiellaceae bacterium]|nr:glycosyltransferase [Gaiellaceae bacterium]
MKAPKILAVASAVDLDFRYGCTPAWWQLWKGLYEVGVDLVVTPYRGRPVESPWWRTAANPTWVEGEGYARVRDGLARVKGDRYLRRAEAVFWAADTEFFAPHEVEKVHDVFFYGYGDKFRRDWMAAMVGEPSRRAPELEFALGGRDYRGDIGRAWVQGDVPFNTFARAISQARINLNITRRSHASVYASSSCRPFELAACGAAIVSNPYNGIERWFEPGKELLVVNDADEALAAYQQLLDDPGQAEAMGQRARERVLDEHTYAHRARQVLDLVGLGRTADARV